MALTPSRGPHGRTVHVIGERVVGGTYPPGTVIDPAALEAELEVSHTVVRESLRVLTAKGLVAARPRHGTVVRPRQEWSLLDPDLLRWQASAHGADSGFLLRLAEVRSIIEPAGARLAALRHTAQDLDELSAALRAMTDAGPDAEAATEADLRFHRALLVAAHNELMLPMEAVIEAGLRARDQLVHHGQSVADPVPTHQHVVDAVRDRDPVAAEAAMRGLLDQSESDVSRALLEREAPAGRGGLGGTGPDGTGLDCTGTGLDGTV
jgi:DNA-binding FadR family transcriptional regulator